MHPPWVPAFLAALRATGVVARAARAAGATYSKVYALRGKDADFRAAWEEALEESYDTLEAELLRRAVEGVDKPVIYQGEPTYVHERDADGNLVMEAYDVHTVDKDGNSHVTQSERPKLALGADGRPRVLTVNEKSDALLMFALKGRRKRVYAERTELTGSDGGPVSLDSTARVARVAHLVALAAKRKADEAAADFSDLA